MTVPVENVIPMLKIDYEVIIMYDLCFNCGENHQDKEVDPTGQLIICLYCGFKQKFQRLPLFVITGACGTGKSTLWNEVVMMENKPDLVYLENDMLLVLSQFGNYSEWWLWICFNISQSGRPVTLFGGGNPSDFENALRRQYFSNIHYLALTCDSKILEGRLRARPEWRKSSRPEFLRKQQDWNQWFIDNEKSASPPYSILDTSYKNKEECAKELIDWIIQSLGS